MCLRVQDSLHHRGIHYKTHEIFPNLVCTSGGSEAPQAAVACGWLLTKLHLLFLCSFTGHRTLINQGCGLHHSASGLFPSAEPDMQVPR